MQFNNEIRHAIQTGLIKEYDFLLNGSLDFLRQNFESYQRVVLERVSLKIEPFALNFGSCENFMISSRNDVSFATFGLKKGDGRHWWDNEILFPFSQRMPEFDEWGTPRFEAYRKWQDNLHFDCENEFWLDDKNLMAYEGYANLNIFDNIVFKDGQLFYFENKREFILVKAIWLDYVRALVELFFPEFEYNIQFSGKKMRRYLMRLREDVWFGFEYGEAEMTYQIRKGKAFLPDYLNLVLIAPSFNKNEDVLNYYHKNNASILSLGMLGNPFFYPPCFPMLGYCAIDSERNYERGTPYLTNIITLDSETYQIIHPEEHGESMKKHAFFYMSLLATTSKIYIDYLIVVLKNVFT